MPVILLMPTSPTYPSNAGYPSHAYITCISFQRRLSFSCLHRLHIQRWLSFPHLCCLPKAEPTSPTYPSNTTYPRLNLRHLHILPMLVILLMPTSPTYPFNAGYPSHAYVACISFQCRLSFSCLCRLHIQCQLSFPHLCRLPKAEPMLPTYPSNAAYLPHVGYPSPRLHHL